jgi:hypothetical protein
MVRKIVKTTRAQERIKFIREIDEQIRIRKESDIFTSNQQTPKINKGERKQQVVLNYTEKKILTSDRYLSILTLNINGINFPIKKRHSG